MKISVQAFLEHYSHFEHLGEPKIAHYLDFCERVHCPIGKWSIGDDDSRQIEGIRLRTAHYLQMELTQIAFSAAMGAAIQRGGSMPTPPDMNDLGSTTYGQQFKALQKKLPGRSGITFRL